jgi:aromatic ring-opening dioxygenase catalytic subunit (LigB family)
VRELLGAVGIPTSENANRGFDHGTFIPLGLIYPAADIPVVTLSMKSSYDPAEHIRVGQALAPLRDEGVLIIGSGLSYHNMRGFGQPGSMAVSQAFDAYLNDAVSQPDAALRTEKLTHWEGAPSARLAHPQEDHLIPLMVVAGAAANDVGQRFLVDMVMNVAMVSYRFG